MPRTLWKPHLKPAKSLLDQGLYREALERLEAHPRSKEPEWWRLRGWARWHLGDETGLEDVRHAAELKREGAGWAWQDLGALLFRRGDWVGAAQALERALDHFRAEGDTEGVAWALHGLGVSALHRGEVAEGLSRAEGAWATVRRAALTGFAGRALVLLSCLHRARGELDEALFRAEQALGKQLDEDDRIVALRAKGTALRLAGCPAQALPPLQEAASRAGEGARRAAALAELAPALLLLGRGGEAERAVGEALPHLGAHASARGRALVTLAEISRKRRSWRGALALLGEARLLGPYPLMEEALAFPELFDLAGRHGLELPRVEPSGDKAGVRLFPHGERRLQVGGRKVPLEGSGRAFDLMVYLALEGPTGWEAAASALWEGEKSKVLYQRLKHTASRARDLLADAEAVRLRGGVVSLDPERVWEVVGGKGRFLEGLWTEWALGRRDPNCQAQGTAASLSEIRSQ